MGQDLHAIVLGVATPRHDASSILPLVKIYTSDDYLSMRHLKIIGIIRRMHYSSMPSIEFTHVMLVEE